MQEVIVVLIVGVAALYCFKRFIKSVKNKSSGSCGCDCSYNSKDSEYKDIIK